MRLEECQHKALLGFAAFTTLYAVAEPILRPIRRDCEPADFDPVKELLHAITLGRSTTTFVRNQLASQPWLDSMVVSKFSTVRNELVDNLELRFPQLALIRDLVERHCKNEQKHACLQAITTLFNDIAFLVDNAGDPQQMKVIWGWGNEVDAVFLAMCSKRNAVALVILAHYAVLISLNTGLWHLRGWPAALLRHIETLLMGEWDEGLDWPRQVISGAATSWTSASPSITVPTTAEC
ncbi:hypothetical protein J7T55_012405 [Diaporthe amygdali]|uniref:uncharacterized protein n=1 Tax=Phomopsis amygdali TaxID=1214568 RepID=UPI0022FDF805|nr:uncharacterized protein J7T55_012405 [Diaporthe amygdali]KAJ0123933.1 hypothetical protein J7T55_012405 [Diaporthe amygdali]